VASNINITNYTANNAFPTLMACAVMSQNCETVRLDDIDKFAKRAL
jgi:hypothetical protein